MGHGDWTAGLEDGSRLTAGSVLWSSSHGAAGAAGLRGVPAGTCPPPDVSSAGWPAPAARQGHHDHQHPTGSGSLRNPSDSRALPLKAAVTAQTVLMYATSARKFDYSTDIDNCISFLKAVPTFFSNNTA